MYSASQGWAHFNNVYILVPASWSQVPDAQPAHEVHEDAQIRVEPTSSIYGDSPFTLQTGECGEEGEFIQVISSLVFHIINLHVSDNTKLSKSTCKHHRLCIWTIRSGVPL